MRINYKNLMKGKKIPLTVLMILACSLLTGDTSIIFPSFLFIGIITGMIKKSSLNEVVLSGLIGFLIGSIIAMVLSIITIYYAEGGLYTIAVIQYSWIYVIACTFIGCVGNALGYYVREEIESRG